MDSIFFVVHHSKDVSLSSISDEDFNGCLNCCLLIRNVSFFSLAAFKTFFLSLDFSGLYMICLGSCFLNIHLAWGSLQLDVFG